MIDESPDIIVHPQKGKKEQALPAQAIVVPNPADSIVAEKIFLECGAHERFLYNSKLFVDSASSCCLAGPCLGAPAAGLVLEKLIVLGVKSIILVSCCGSVDNRLKVGDVVIANKAVVGEGLSSYYGTTHCLLPSERIIGLLRQLLKRQQHVWQEGAVWSTDAPYRECRSALAELKNKEQVIGVDMEFSALCSIAAFRGVELGGIFIVSDELWGKQWRPGFGSNIFKSVREQVIGGIIDFTINVRGHNGKDI